MTEKLSKFTQPTHWGSQIRYITTFKKHIDELRMFLLSDPLLMKIQSDQMKMLMKSLMKIQRSKAELGAIGFQLQPIFSKSYLLRSQMVTSTTVLKRLNWKSVGLTFWPRQRVKSQTYRFPSTEKTKVEFQVTGKLPYGIFAVRM